MTEPKSRFTVSLRPCFSNSHTFVRYGEIVGTFVRRKEGSTLTAEELRAFCVGKTPTLSIPSYYWFVDEFPLLNNGKVSKPELRKIAEATKEDMPKIEAPKKK